MADERASRPGPIPAADAIGEKTLAVPPEAARVGTIIARRYEILGFLGKGGMGLVYRARDMELSEEVAIKLLQPEFTRDLSEIERLKREIVTARKITHPNVIRLHDFGLDETDEGFISMEVLPGGSLADRLDRGPVPIPEALDVAIGVAEGLAAAHDKGIVHRDIKPENVLFDEDGVPKLVDFGLARGAGSQNTVWAITGTPRYMSPEQTDGQKATPKSDVYSTGILLFYLFTGRLPFLADNLLALATQHAEEPPPRLRAIRLSVPPRIEQIVLKCLEKDPAKRYPSARALAADLRAVRDAGVLARDDGDTAKGLAATDRTEIVGGALPDAASSEPTAAGTPARPGGVNEELVTAPHAVAARAPSERTRSPVVAAAPAGEQTLIHGPPAKTPMDAERTVVGPGGPVAPAAERARTPRPKRFDPLETQPKPAARSQTDWRLWVGGGAVALGVAVLAYILGTRL